MNTPSAGVFERHEIKFMTDSRQRDYLVSRMMEEMIPDSHGESTICNVYYDTPDFRLVRRSLEKPGYKEKLRIRSYGQVRGDEDVFIELKKKYKGIVYKRRIQVPYYTAMSYMAGHLPLSQEGQIGREIDYFCHYYGDLRPAVHLCYDRSAYFSQNDPNLRITFDRNIRWSREGLALTCPPEGKQLLEEGHSLLEIKTASAIPLWLVRILNDAEISQISFSKYGTAYETGILPQASYNAAYILMSDKIPSESRGYAYV